MCGLAVTIDAAAPVCTVDDWWTTVWAGDQAQLDKQPCTPNTYVAHPYDCRKYYMCTQGKSWKCFVCGPGTAFDGDAKETSSTANCGIRGSQYEQCVADIPANKRKHFGDVTPAPVKPINVIQPIGPAVCNFDDSWTTIWRGDQAELGLEPCVWNTYIAHPYDCRKFYMCTQGEKWQCFVCGGGTAFNGDAKATSSTANCALQGRQYNQCVAEIPAKKKEHEELIAGL